MKTLLIIMMTLFTVVNKTAIAALSPLVKPKPKPEVSFVTLTDYEIKTADGATLTLRAGTPIVVEASQTYNAKNLSEGQTVNVRVKYNVIVNKQTLVAAGALGTANISDLVKPGAFGKAGRMELQMQSVQAVDGQQILLSGTPMIAEGQNKKGLAWGLSIGLFLLTIIGGIAGIFIKGKPAEVKAGTTTNTSVASDAQVQVEVQQQQEALNNSTERSMKKRDVVKQ
jgi:hypothetical protein